MYEKFQVYKGFMDQTLQEFEDKMSKYTMKLVLFDETENFRDFNHPLFNYPYQR